MTPKGHDGISQLSFEIRSSISDIALPFDCIFLWDLLIWYLSLFLLPIIKLPISKDRRKLCYCEEKLDY